MFIALSIICLIGVFIDIVMLLLPFQFYMWINEALHYAQLIIIGGGIYLGKHFVRAFGYLKNLLGFREDNEVAR